MSFWKIIIALLVFSLIIIIHEFGHFIVAKYNKVGVIEFSLGMGPRIISWGKTEKGYKVLFFKTTKWLEANPIFGDNTLYSWKLLPFGGSCMMLGEDDMSVEDINRFTKDDVVFFPEGRKYGLPKDYHMPSFDIKRITMYSKILVLIVD